MEVDDRIKELESKVEYLTKIVENHIIGPAADSEDRTIQKQNMVKETFSIFERHPAFKSPESQAMLKDVLKPIMRTGDNK
jgi:hypothetical protein